ncbi:MAG: YbhB/YbcL family Raf kinase inhibitor-like protein [Geminicoccaceae bacterium]|nr:YbhB/YbcL family Raf kinase inhibitor-like protein [Geminicoccaceae bacterium]MDW8342638.1 YbhB/YbcL family Raf kinase inhibitor-like protein [Geminicoccaceae bacterium]
MAAMRLASPAFAAGGRIPERYTCDGADLSPPLSWSGAPVSTRSFVLVCEDPDAPAGTWYHWAVFDIPADQTSLPEGLAKTEKVGRLRQAINDFRKPGYGGPCPPRGHGTHHYRFRLLALSVGSLPLGPRPGCREVLSAAEPHILAGTELVGTYSR